MSFDQDQRAAIKLIAEAAISESIDEKRIRKKVIWTNFIGIGSVSVLATVLLFALPEIATGRALTQMYGNLPGHLGRLADVEAEVAATIVTARTAITDSEKAASQAKDAFHDARRAMTRANTALADLDRIDQLDTETTETIEYLDRVRAARERNRDLDSVLSAIANEPTLLNGVLYNTNHESQGVRTSGYWRSKGGTGRVIPLDEDLTVEARTGAIAVMAATGVTRPRTSDAEIHIGFVTTHGVDEGDPPRHLGHANWFRISYRPTSSRFQDDGGWSPFSLSTIVYLDPGTHTLGLGTIAPNDTDWEFHNVSVDVMVLRTSLSSEPSAAAGGPSSRSSE